MNDGGRAYFGDRTHLRFPIAFSNAPTNCFRFSPNAWQNIRSSITSIRPLTTLALGNERLSFAKPLGQLVVRRRAPLRLELILTPQPFRQRTSPDPNLRSPEHGVHKPQFGDQAAIGITAGLAFYGDMAFLDPQKTPLLRHILRGDHSGRTKIIAPLAHSGGWLLAHDLLGVAQEIDAARLALDQRREAIGPADDVGTLFGDRSELVEHRGGSAAQPADADGYKCGMSHFRAPSASPVSVERPDRPEL